MSSTRSVPSMPPTTTSGVPSPVTSPTAGDDSCWSIEPCTLKRS
jgi:hypothetical protein